MKKEKISNKQKPNVEENPSDCPYIIGEKEDPYPFCSAFAAENVCCVWAAPNCLEWVHEDLYYEYKEQFGKLSNEAFRAFREWVYRWWFSKNFEEYLTEVNRKHCRMCNPDLDISTPTEEETGNKDTSHVSEKLKGFFAFIREDYASEPMCTRFGSVSCDCTDKTPVILTSLEKYGAGFSMDDNDSSIVVVILAVNPYLSHLAKQNYVATKKVHEMEDKFDLNIVCPICGKEKRIYEAFVKGQEFFLAGKGIQTDISSLESYLKSCRWDDLLEEYKRVKNGGE